MRVSHPVHKTLLAATIAVPAMLTYGADQMTPDVGAVGQVELGIGYPSDDNFSFGRYNGWNKDEAGVLANTDYQRWSPGGLLDYIEVHGRDLGLDTRQAHLVVGGAGSYELAIALDQQKYVGNFTGRTPFSGGDQLVLPSDWVASNTTSGMLAFDSVSQSFDQEMKRELWSIDFSKNFGSNVVVSAGYSSEDKTGDSTFGAAIYLDPSSSRAAILPRPVDFTTDQFDLTVAFRRAKLSLDLSYLYSNFENQSSSLSWDNPYADVFGPGVDYPNGEGQVALEPDNEMQRFRLLGSYLVTPQLRFKVDGSYAETTQDDSFLPYTINPLLVIDEPLPRTDLDGKVETTTFKVGAHYRPVSKLTVAANWRYEDRDNSSPRNGYRYVRGDAEDQPQSQFTVYNAAHRRRVNRTEIDARYRLPKRNRLQASYAYEEIDRWNTSVEETEEDIYTLALTSHPLQSLSTRIEVEFRDRGASTYDWSQSYFALLDSELINQTPDSQRYITHPLLYQYQLANREQWRGSASLNYLPADNWSLDLKLIHTENNFDQSYLGLQEDSRDHATLSASLLPSKEVSLTAYLSYDYYEVEQLGRSFRGGPDKNAFEIFPPLPQASDPSRDWKSEEEDETWSLGFSLQWQVISDRLDTEINYSYVDSTGEQEFTTYGADIDDTPLPDLDNEQHNIKWLTTYQLKERIDLKFEYQYFSYEESNWAVDDVRPDTIDRVLWTGESSPDDDIHFFQASVVYRLQ